MFAEPSHGRMPGLGQRGLRAWGLFSIAATLALLAGGILWMLRRERRSPVPATRILQS